MRQSTIKIIDQENKKFQSLQQTLRQQNAMTAQNYYDPEINIIQSKLLDFKQTPSDVTPAIYQTPRKYLNIVESGTQLYKSTLRKKQDKDQISQSPNFNQSTQHLGLSHDTSKTYNGQNNLQTFRSKIKISARDIDKEKDNDKHNQSTANSDLNHILIKQESISKPVEKKNFKTYFRTPY